MCYESVLTNVMTDPCALFWEVAGHYFLSITVFERGRGMPPIGEFLDLGLLSFRSSILALNMPESLPF